MDYLKQAIQERYEGDDEEGYKSDDDDDDDESNNIATRFHSMFRKMSIAIQRDEGTPDRDIVSGTARNPSQHERALMLNIPHYSSDSSDVGETLEDDTLPTIEEVATDAVQVTNPPCTRYFENPFESDTSEETINVETAHPLFKHALSASPQEIENKAQVKAKLQWSKTFEKIKIVNALSSHNRKSSSSYYTTSKQPLAPYFPSAFTPGYLSLMCRDEHGRKAPPILFDALNASITDSSIDHSSLHRSWSFRIELCYGEIKWVIHRTIIEFYNLHLTLKFKYVSGVIAVQPPSFPSQLAHLTNAALTSMRIAREEDDPALALKRRTALESYLRALIQSASLLVNYELCDFLEISALSMVRDMGWKGKEGYLEYNLNPSSYLKWNRWQKKWIILRDSYMAFCKDIASTSPTDVLLFDKSFKVSKNTGAFGAIHHTHFVIKNATRLMEVKAPTSKYLDDWMENLEKVQKASPWVMEHRFRSFAPVRDHVKAKWFVDGHEYYEAVIQAILTAKSEIYIEDWWLSPQLYLRRPPKGNEEYRLDRLLKRKATEGVMIYIVIYKSVSLALPIDSQHTYDWMKQIHPNILVQKHANLTSSPFWAHHEKILVIDNRLAFVGGLDLCFGRYDTFAHSLTDSTSTENEVFPGQDYSNPRIKDFDKVCQYGLELIDKRTTPRMPWHDIHTAMTGLPARDIARHFVQRWNFIKSNRSKERTDIPFLLPKGEYVAAKDEPKFRGTCRIQILRSSAEWSQGIVREHSIYSAYMESIFKAKHFIYIENQFFITTTSPHDKLIKNKIGQALVERIKRAHKEKQKFRVIVVIPVAPGFEGDFTQFDRRSMPLRSVAQYQYRSISRGKYSIFEQLRKEGIPAQNYIGFFSLRNWGKIPPARDHLGQIIPPAPPPPPPSYYGKRLLNKKRVKSRSSSQNTSMDDLTLSEVETAQQNQYSDGRMDFVTEQVYIHSKLMIVDDKLVICGSANLNDRSQLGNRDSEIAVVVEDTDLVDSQMNGRPYKAAKYALSLRTQLFKEHLGLLRLGGEEEDEIVADPLSDEFYEHIWKKTAETNTLIYRDVFRCVPDDTVHNIEQHRQFVPERVLPGHVAEPWNRTCEQIQAKLNEIQGHLVEFPTEYMKNISMTASVIQEAFPPIVFT